MDIETIGYFLYMEEQEKKEEVKNRSGDIFSTSWEQEPQQERKTE